MRPDLREWRRCGNHIAQEKHKPRHPTTEPNPLRREENLGKCSQQGLLWRQSSEDCAPRAGGYSRSLVGELSPHMPHGVAENQNLQSAVPPSRKSHLEHKCLSLSRPVLRKAKVKVAQSCPTLCDTMDLQSLEFSRPEYWSG